MDEKWGPTKNPKGREPFVFLRLLWPFYQPLYRLLSRQRHPSLFPSPLHVPDFARASCIFHAHVLQCERSWRFVGLCVS